MKNIQNGVKKPPPKEGGYIKHTQKDGGDKRDRTADLLNAIQALSQLSYTPRWEHLKYLI